MATPKQCVNHPNLHNHEPDQCRTEDRVHSSHIIQGMQAILLFVPTSSHAGCQKNTIFLVACNGWSASYWVPRTKPMCKKVHHSFKLHPHDTSNVKFCLGCTEDWSNSGNHWLDPNTCVELWQGTPPPTLKATARYRYGIHSQADGDQPTGAMAGQT